MGVDLGLSYIKVAVARPGKGLELVTNEQAKRKTPAAVGFTEDGERLFGDAAVAYAAKAPKRVILDGRSLIGQCDSQEEPFCLRQRRAVDGAGNFTGEEVIAMLLAMARKQASTFLGGTVIKDVAVTVPAWYDERQRMAIADAAKIIGLNCLGVVNANTAAAIKYALDGKAKPTEDKIAEEKQKDKKKKTPKSITQRVLFFDVGAGSSSASVVEITSDVKTGISSNIRVLSHASEQGVSGRLLDSVIVDRLADAFDKQRSKDATPSRDLPRVMTRLRKEAQRAREVLSANSETMVSIGSLYDDMDLRTPLSRTDFESDAKSMLQLVVGPAKAALAEAELTINDLDAMVPNGGASRTPRIQEEMKAAFGLASLNKTINTDEAAVMGSVFFAASMSSTFRVRKMEVDDIYKRGVSVEIDREGSGGLFSGSKKSFQTVEVFPDTGSKVPSKKTVSLNRNADFSMRIFLNMDKAGKSRFPERTLYAKVNVKGVAEVLEKMQDKKKKKSTTPRVAISFHIDRSGLVRIGTAESSADETIVVEREVEVKEDKKDKKKGDGKSDEKADDKKEDTKDDEKEEETSSDSESSDEKGDSKDKSKGKEKAKKKTKIEKSSQTIVHRHALTVEFVEGEGLFGQQMSGADFENAQKVFKDLEIADKERVERADAYNALEGFILEVRSNVRGLDEDDDLYKVSTEEAREALVTAFDDAEDWMYTEEAKLTINLRKKHHELRNMYSPMEDRARELERRPKLIKKLKNAINESVERIASLREAHVTANSSHVAEFDKYPEYVRNLTQWLDEKEAEQNEAPLTEDPTFTVKNVTEKSQELVKEINRLATLDIPVVTKAPSSEKETADPSSDAEEPKTQGANSTDEEANAEEDPAAKDKSSEDSDLPPNPDADSVKADGSASSGSAKDEL